MTTVAPQSVVPRPFPPVHRPRGTRFLGYLSTTDPKRWALRAEAHPQRGWEPLQDSESSPHLAIGMPSTDPNDDQGT